MKNVMTKVQHLKVIHVFTVRCAACLLLLNLFGDVIDQPDEGPVLPEMMHIALYCGGVRHLSINPFSPGAWALGQWQLSS